MSTTTNAAARKPGAMWLEITLIVAAVAGARLTASAVGGTPERILEFVAGVLLVGLYWRCAVWAERVARRKGIYHPQYFVLGPIGLVMAVCTRSQAPRNRGAAE